MLDTIASALVAAAFFATGGGAIVAPRGLSKNYGIAALDSAAVAYVRATGARDLVLGCIVLAFVVRRDRAALATTVSACALAAAADFALVFREGGPPARGSLLIHAGGTAGLLMLAALLRADS